MEMGRCVRARQSKTLFSLIGLHCLASLEVSTTLKGQSQLFDLVILAFFSGHEFGVQEGGNKRVEMAWFLESVNR